MNIKAIIPAGLTEITVNGLHQWDYGRKLEIHNSSLPALVEVHFACMGMEEAVVRSCSVTNGVAIAAIPDRCLEQTTPITAWVYELDGNSGVTTTKIILNIEPRTRPCPSQDIPVDIADKYTEAVAAMNAAVANVAAGNVTTARAIADGDGKNIPNTYATKAALKAGTDGEPLSVDIFAKADEIANLGGCLKREFYFITGYPLDAAGNPVNLPHKDAKNSRVTIETFFGNVAIYLWTYPSYLPNYYIKRGSGGTWNVSNWVSLVDSKNIGSYEAKRAQYIPVSLSIKIAGGIDGAANADLTYYQDGAKQTIKTGEISAGSARAYNITADLGSQLSMSNTWGVFEYEEDDIPLVTKSRSGAVGEYEYKTRFVVIGGGTVAVSISDKV